MKSRILSFSILKENMKKQIWIPALIALGFFLSMPVAGMVYLEWLQSAGTGQAGIIEKYTMFLAGNVLFIPSMTMGSALLTGVGGFSWLHSRSRTDFYHSLPIRREKIFLGQTVLSIAYFAVPYLVNLLVSYVIGMVEGVLGGSTVRLPLQSFLFQLMFYLLIYLVVVLAMLLTGKILAGVLGAVVLMVYCPVLSLLLQGFAEEFLKTYAEKGAVLGFLQDFSPIVAYSIIYRSAYTSVPAKVWVLGLLGILVLLALCFGLYKMRLSEAAGHTMAFYRIGKFVQYLLEVLVILGSGILFYSVTVRSSLGWMLFGILLGGVLAHGILEVVYEGDIRQAMAHKWVLSASIATTLVVLGIFCWDLFGYDSFFPRQEELDAVRIQAEGEIYPATDYAGDNRELAASMGRMAEDPQVYRLLEDIKENQLDVERTANGLQYVRANGEKVEDIRAICVQYVVDGRTRYRDYRVEDSQFRQQLVALYDSQDYKKTIYPLLTMPEKELEGYIESVVVSSIRGCDTSLFSGNSQVQAKFLETYRAELAQMSQQTLAEESPVGKLELAANWEAVAADNWYTEEKAEEIGDVSYFIYPSFTRTLALLEEQGVELPSAFAPEEIESITLYHYFEDDGDADPEEQVIRDKAKIRELAHYLHSRDCNNGWQEDETGYTAVVRIIREGDSTDVPCTIEKGSVQHFTP